MSILRTAILAGLLAWSPFSLSADTQNPQVGDLLNILVGAYNGAAEAAAKNDGTTAKTIDRAQLNQMENMLSRYQGDLQGLVNTDGQVDIGKLGQFLNRLQVENHGKVSYDFGQALQVLGNVNPDDGIQGLLNQQVISKLVLAAKDQDLNRDLSEAAPYVGTMLQLGSLLVNQQDKHAADSQALSAEIDALKAIATRYQAQPDLTQQVATLTAQLKLLYADQALGTPANAATINAMKQSLASLRQQVIAARPRQLPDSSYEAILRPLAALGQPFAEQYSQWQALRAGHGILGQSQHFDSETRKLLNALNYDALPPDVQKALLQRLNIEPLR